MPVVGTFERPELVYRRYVTNTYSDGLSPENTFRKHAGSRSGRQGEVTDYYDSEANPLLGVTIDGREYLVPAVEEFIAGIDFEGRRLRMTLPEGLLSLND